MEELLYTFEADRSQEIAQLIWAIVATVAFLAVLIYLKKKPLSEDKKHLEKTGIMLMGFGLIISIGSIFGIAWRLQRLGPVEIYKNRFVSSYGEVSYDELKNVYIHTGHDRSLVSPSIELDTTRLAYFEERKGRAYVFSDEHYDVEGIVRAVRPIMDGE